DVLVGCATGVALATLSLLITLALPEWLGYSVELRSGLDGLAHPGTLVGLANGLGPIGDSMQVLFLLFLMRMLLRSEGLAGGTVLFLSVLLLSFALSAPWIVVPIIFIRSALYLYVLVRFGLVASIFTWYVVIILMTFPMTLQTSVWYSTVGFAGLSVILALTVYAFRTSL